MVVVPGVTKAYAPAGTAAPGDYGRCILVVILTLMMPQTCSYCAGVRNGIGVHSLAFMPAYGPENALGNASDTELTRPRAMVGDSRATRFKARGSRLAGPRHGSPSLAKSFPKVGLEEDVALPVQDLDPVGQLGAVMAFTPDSTRPTDGSRRHGVSKRSRRTDPLVTMQK